MRLYHGAEKIVRSPKFGVGRPYNDFGLGFYCTADNELAADWAASKDRNGFISVYAFDDNGLRIIDLCSSQYTILHWLSLLMDYREFDTSSILLHRAREYVKRNFEVEYQSCDCISGYRADNVNFALAQLFLNGELSFQCLRQSLLESDRDTQLVIKSNRAFGRISYVGYQAVYAADVYPAKVSHEIERYKSAVKSNKQTELYIRQMIDEDIKAYDSRIQ